MKQAVTKQVILSIEPHRFHLMWSHTMLALRVYQNRANEGKDVQAAFDFGRWLRQIGLVRLFETHPQPEPLPVDGCAMDRAIGVLLDTCAEQTKSNAPRIVDVSEVERLNFKVDVLAQAIAQMLPERARAEVTSRKVPSSLQLLENESR